MNIVFITMMFGTGLPILFPIAAASLTVLFCLEKFMLYYVYKQPPTYDEKLNNSVLSNLSYAPLFLLSFGYWILTNKQIISNDYLRPVSRKSESFQADHTWYRALTPEGVFHSGPAGFLLVFFFAYAFYLTFRGTFEWIGKACCCKNMFMEEFEVDEEIDLYQNCLDNDDKDWTLKEEENSQKYGIQSMMFETKQSIQQGRMSDDKFHLQGVHTYDILRNPIYSQAFQYFAANLDHRKDYIIDGDDDDKNDTA
jgi:hypothetical protein